MITRISWESGILIAVIVALRLRWLYRFIYRFFRPLPPPGMISRRHAAPPSPPADGPKA